MLTINKESHQPIYLQLMKNIKNLIEQKNLSSGERIPSRPWLMETFGVSDGTVKKTIDKLVQEGVLYREKGKGLFVARCETRKNVIGLLSLLKAVSLGSHSDVFNADLEYGIKQYAIENHCELLLIPEILTTSSKGEFANKYAHVDGFIMIQRDYENGCIGWINELGTPIVSVMKNKHYGDQVDAVEFDNYRGAYLAVEHLVQQSHRRIALIAGQLWSQSHKERLKGYKKALKDCGLEFNPELVVESGYSIEHGYRSMNELLNRNIDFTGVFAMGDNLAIGAMKALKNAGCKIPLDKSVVGFMNLAIADICEPGLTTINMPVVEMGQAAMDTIIKKINHEKVIFHCFKPKLVARGSTSKAKE